MGNMFGTTIQPQDPVSFYNVAYGTRGNPAQTALAGAIANAAYVPGSPESGVPTFAGLPGYQGQLSPTTNANLTGSWSNWQPWNAGNEYVASWLGGQAGGGGQPGSATPGQMSPWAIAAQKNYSTYGGQGFPAQSLSASIQYGAPSQVGQYMSNIAQGGGTPAMYLSPFLNARPYQARWA